MGFGQHRPREEERDLQASDRPLGKPRRPSKRPIDNDALWGQIAALRESIPEEAWQGFPHDSSVNLDHYLYGSPKTAT